MDSSIVYGGEIENGGEGPCLPWDAMGRATSSKERWGKRSGREERPFLFFFLFYFFLKTLGLF